MAFKPRVFLDSSALIAGSVSRSGAAHAILTLANADLLTVVISEQVKVECERNLEAKAPRAVQTYRRVLAAIKPEVRPDPTREQVETAQAIIGPKDAPILAAAMTADMDYLVTLDHKHFLDDPGVAQKSGLRLGTPGDFLIWFRERTAGDKV